MHISRSCHAKLTHFKDHLSNWFLLQSSIVQRSLHVVKSIAGDLGGVAALGTLTLIFTGKRIKLLYRVLRSRAMSLLVDFS